MKQSLTTTYLLLIISMALWGGTWVAGRILAQSIHPMSAAFLRFAVASITLLAICWYSEKRLPHFTRKQFLPLLFLGATGVFTYSYFFFTGLQTTSASRAALIVACIPVCIFVLSTIFYGERLTVIRVTGALLSLVGVSVVIADGNPLILLSGEIRHGDILILGCVASWTAYTLGGRSVMKGMSPLTAVTWSSIFGTMLLFPVALMNGLAGEIVRARFLDWGCIVYLGVLATGFAYLWYYQAIAKLGPARSGIFINTVPVFAAAMGFLLLGEPAHLTLLLGGCMVLTGVYLTNRP